MAEEISLEELLGFREYKYKKRLELEKECSCLISMTLCIPAEFRLTEKYKSFLRRSADEVCSELLKGGTRIIRTLELDGADGLTVFIITDGDSDIKRKCILLEATLPAGRLLDIDVSCGSALSRRDMGLPPRRCFICGGEAAVCVAGQKHSRQEIADYIRSMEKLITGLY